MRDPSEPPAEPTATPADTAGNARRYARIRYRLMLAELPASIAWLATVQWSGASAALAAWAHRLPSDWLAVAAYLTVFGVATYAAFLPVDIYRSFILEHRFGLSRLRWRDWVVRELKQVALSSLLGLVLIEGLYALLRAAPRTWMFWATAGWIAVTVLLARVFPTVLVPLFYKTAPLTDAGLAKRLVQLCERAGLAVLGVFRVDLGVETRKANAALAGLGRTRRVLLSDTLLGHFTEDEIETVLAHELGHQRFRHITWFLVLSTVGSLFAFWMIDWASRWWVPALGLRGLDDIAGLPMLMLALSVLGLLGLPLQSGISRAFEWQSDRYAVRLTGRPQAFASALRKLESLNLADPSPPAWIEWLFYDHPAIRKRIAAADAAGPAA
jgi:STE24 endopeptidase